MKNLSSKEHKKAVIFVRHIERHLRDMFNYDAKVVCKICDKTIDQIYKEEKDVKEHN